MFTGRIAAILIIVVVQKTGSSVFVRRFPGTKPQIGPIRAMISAYMQLARWIQYHNLPSLYLTVVANGRQKSRSVFSWT